jgi:hypothetical protein
MVFGSASSGLDGVIHGITVDMILCRIKKIAEVGFSVKIRDLQKSRSRCESGKKRRSIFMQSMYPWQLVRSHCVQNQKWMTSQAAEEVVICNVPYGVVSAVLRGDGVVAHFGNESRIILRKMHEIIIDLTEYGYGFLMRDPSH